MFNENNMKTLSEHKKKADSMTFLIKQIEVCQAEVDRLENRKRIMNELNEEGFVFEYTAHDFAEVESELSDWRRGILQYTNQLEKL